MIKVKIYTVGKDRKPWLIKALAAYEDRLKSFLRFSWIYYKTDAELKTILQKEKRFLALDRKGTSLSSQDLATTLQQEWERNGAKLTFIIGGPIGIEEKILLKATHKISLSFLTFTHQMTRLILMEQLYRTVQIAHKTPYHK